jgi:hypothetical protein
VECWWRLKLAVSNFAHKLIWSIPRIPGRRYSRDLTSSTYILLDSARCPEFINTPLSHVTWLLTFDPLDLPLLTLPIHVGCHRTCLSAMSSVIPHLIRFDELYSRLHIKPIKRKLFAMENRILRTSPDNSRRPTDLT